MGKDKFSVVWFAGLLLVMSVYLLTKGVRIAWRREIDNPLLQVSGGRAMAVGLAIVAVALAGIAMAAVEALRLRG